MLWDVLDAFAKGDLEAATVALALHVVTESRAERVFVMSTSGGVLAGVDADGLELPSAEQRLDPHVLTNARKQRGVRGGVRSDGDVAFKTSRGSRLTIAGAHGVVVLEHRYHRGAFDRLDSEHVAHWSTLLDLLSRLAGPSRAARLTDAEARAEVSAALHETGGNITHAAARLGLSRLGLKKRMIRLGLRKV